MDKLQSKTAVNFGGIPVSAFTIDSPTTGAFYKHIRINPTTLYLETWNGTIWITPGGGSAIINTSKVQAVPTIMYYLVPPETGNDWIIAANEAGNPRWFNNVTTCFSTVYALANANTSVRYKILIYPGQFIPSANLTIRNNMVIEFMHGAEIKSSSYSINMTNGAIKGDGVLDIRISSSTEGGNLAIIHGSYFKRLECNNWTMVKANIINELICNADTADVEIDVVRISTLNIRGKASVHAHSIVTLTSTGNAQYHVTADSATTCICTGYARLDIRTIESLDARSANDIFVNSDSINTARLKYGAYINAQYIVDLFCYYATSSYNTNTINASYIQRAILQGTVMINANKVLKLACLGVQGINFNVEVNCNEIGEVDSIYGWTGDEYIASARYPFHVNNDYYCHCIPDGGVGRFFCENECACVMLPKSNDVAFVPDGFVRDKGVYPGIQKSRLLIRANRRLDARWFIAVGTVIAHIQRFEYNQNFTDEKGNPYYVPHTYIQGLHQGLTTDTADMTQLKIYGLTEQTADGYQLSGNCVLVMDNVNSHNYQEAISKHDVTNQNPNNHSRVSLKNCTIRGDYSGPNVWKSSTNGSNLLLNATGTYGNFGAVNCTPINANADIIIDTDNYWM